MLGNVQKRTGLRGITDNDRRDTFISAGDRLKIVRFVARGDHHMIDRQRFLSKDVSDSYGSPGYFHNFRSDKNRDAPASEPKEEILLGYPPLIGEYIVKRFDHRNFLALIVQCHRSLYADNAAANDRDILPRHNFSRQHVFRHEHVGTVDAGDVRNIGFCTYGNNDLFRSDFFDKFLRCFLIEIDLNTQFLDPSDQVGGKIPELLFPLRAGGDVKFAAEAIRFFRQVDLIPVLRRETRGLKAGGTSADDQQPFFPGSVSYLCP